MRVGRLERKGVEINQDTTEEVHWRQDHWQQDHRRQDHQTKAFERSKDIIRLLIQHDHQKVEAKVFDQIEIRAPGAQSLIEVLNHLFRTTLKGRFE